jgi:hypothetical protein
LLCDATLASIQAHHVPPGPHGLSGRVALGVDTHEDLAGFGFAVGAGEIIFAVGVKHAALGIPQELVVFDGAVIVDVQRSVQNEAGADDFTDVAPLPTLDFWL